MAITPLNMLLAIPEVPYAAASAPGIAGLFNMTSTATWTAAIVPVNKTGSLTKVWLYLVASNASNVYTVSVETVDGNGNPSGTLWAANTQKTGLTGYGNASILEVTLDAAASVTSGDIIAVVLKPTTYVGNSNWGGYSDGGAGDVFVIATSTSNSGSSWAARASPPTLGLEYSDGSFPNAISLFPIYAVNTTVVNTTSNPRIAGCAVTFPVGVRATGVWVWADNDADARITLFDSDGATVLWTADVDKDLPYSVSTAVVFTLYFPASINLQAGQTYYLMAQGLGASVTVYDLHAFNANALTSLNGGASVKRATATTSSPTGPTDFTTNTDRMGLCGLIFDGVDIPSGGGETSHVFIS
jgi:hypothetical protein